jgi:malate dehydrogenase (oxaloacetate-decarboxylating)(NADP+)
MDDTATVASGVGDTYGEDCAIEDQLVTPWTISVLRSAREHFDFSN